MMCICICIYIYIDIDGFLFEHPRCMPRKSTLTSEDFYGAYEEGFSGENLGYVKIAIENWPLK